MNPPQALCVNHLSMLTPSTDEDGITHHHFTVDVSFTNSNIMQSVLTKIIQMASSTEMAPFASSILSELLKLQNKLCPTLIKQPQCWICDDEVPSCVLKCGHIYCITCVKKLLQDEYPCCACREVFEDWTELKV